MTTYEERLKAALAATPRPTLGALYASATRLVNTVHVVTE